MSAFRQLNVMLIQKRVVGGAVVAVKKREKYSEAYSLFTTSFHPKCDNVCKQRTTYAMDTTDECTVCACVFFYSFNNRND